MKSIGIMEYTEGCNTTNGHTVGPSTVGCIEVRGTQTPRKRERRGRVYDRRGEGIYAYIIYNLWHEIDPRLVLPGLSPGGEFTFLIFVKNLGIVDMVCDSSTKERISTILGYWGEE